MKPPAMPALLRPLCAGILFFSMAAAWAERPDAGPHGRPDRPGHAKRESHHDRDKHADRAAYGPREAGGHRDGGGPKAQPPRGGKARTTGPRLEPGSGQFFGDMQRRSVHEFYAPRLAAGRCPPGLAKKGQGCLPPGQARKWQIGQPLPAGVVRYPLPAELRIRLGLPPAGHEFVRIAGDILLIAIGTSMVIDAIEDLGGR